MWQAQVIGVMVAAIFAIPTLQWGPSHELTHLELFAGECSVTRGEFKDSTWFRRPQKKSDNYKKHQKQLHLVSEAFRVQYDTIL